MEKSFDFGKLLQNNEAKHKSKPMQFVSVAGGVKKRLDTDMKKRKKSRLSVFDKIRNIPCVKSPTPAKEAQSKVEHRRMQLEKWKEEKEKKKKEAMMQKKKPFLTGVPHNALKFVPPPPPSQAIPSTSGRVTRSQSSRNNNNVSQQKLPKEIKQSNNDHLSFAPKNASFNPILKDLLKPTLKTAVNVENKIKTEVLIKEKSKVNSKKAPVKQYERNLRSRSNRTNNTSSKIKDVSPQKYSLASPSSVNSDAKPRAIQVRTPRKSIGKSKMVTPKNLVPKSESSSEEKLRSPKSIELLMTPQQIEVESKKISPHITMSRGKDNARKEMKKKMEEGLLDDDVCEMDSVEHFRRQMDSEIKRMIEMCDTWEKIYEQIHLPDAVQEAILSAIGQAKLLMSQKLKQFASLMLRCQCPEPGQALVTPSDLRGFWDMVFMQIENVGMRFKKLEEMRAREWAEEKPVEVKKKPVPKPAVNKSKPVAATSRLRDMIAAAKKAKKEQSNQTPTEEQQQEEIDQKDQKDQKTFEAGFFVIQSPVKSPRLATPLLKQSLLKAVLSSEAKKASDSNSAASYAMLRASLIGKNVENEVFNDPTPLTPINLTATPSRSILKSNKKSLKKSINVVLFNESDQDIQKTIKDIQNFEKEEIKDHNIDSELSSMDSKEKENKPRRKSKLTRQDAFEGCVIMTRSRRKTIQEGDKNIQESHKEDKSRRKSIQVPNEEDKRIRKKLQEVNVDVETRRRPRKSIDF